MAKETIPSNHMLALMKDAETASVTSDELMEAGFDRPIIVTDERVGKRLEAESSLPARLFQRVSNHLSEEANFLAQYEQAVRDGSVVIAVKANGDDEVARATEVLRKRNAMDIRFFGLLAVSDLTPASNPSWGSDHAPLSP